MAEKLGNGRKEEMGMLWQNQTDMYFAAAHSSVRLKYNRSVFE